MSNIPFLHHNMTASSLLRSFVIGSLVLITMGTLSSCKDNLDLYEAPQVEITPAATDGTILFEAQESTKALTLKTNRKWRVEVSPEAKEWLSVTPTSGEEGSHTITVRALTNSNEEPREATVTVIASSEIFAYSVQQKGISGKTIEYTSLATLSEMAKDYDQNGKTIEEDLRIKATVTNHYSGGNFVFQNFYYIQDAEGNALVLTLGKTDKPLEFGTQLTARLKGGKLSNYNGTVQIGLTGENLTLLGNTPVAPRVVTIDDILAGKCINQYVKIENVQFISPDGHVYYEGTYSFNRNHKIQDKQGKELAAEFYKNTIFGKSSVAQGSGSIQGIATYSVSSGGSTFYNIRPSLESDISMKEARFSVGGSGGDDPDPDPVDPTTSYPVDTKQTALTTLNENFDKLIDKSEDVPAGWSNLAISGDRKWQVRTFNNNVYMQYSAFKYSGPESEVTGALITPKIKGTTLSFNLKAGYSADAELVIQILDATGKITNANYQTINITGVSGYEENFSPYTVNLPQEDCYIVFLYRGSKNKTTTYQIDDVILK